MNAKDRRQPPDEPRAGAHFPVVNPILQRHLNALQMVEVQFAVQRAAAHAQFLRGLRCGCRRIPSSARTINCFSASATVKSGCASNRAGLTAPGAEARAPPQANRAGRFFRRGQHDGVFDGGAQLAHVAGPGIIHQRFERVGREIVHIFVVFRRELLQKPLAPAAECPPSARATAAAQSAPPRSRKNRSSRNFPALTCSSRFLLVAAISRTSAVNVLLEPTRSKVRSPRKRSSLTWTSRQSPRSRPEKAFRPAPARNGRCAARARR